MSTGALIAAVMAAVAVVVVVLPRWWYWQRWARQVRTAQTFRLEAAGDRPSDLVEAAGGISAALGVCAQRRGSGIVLHRWAAGRTITQAVTVYGRVDDPKQVAGQVARAVGAAAVEVDQVPVVPSPGRPWYARRHTWRGRLPQDDVAPDLDRFAGWVSGSAAAEGEWTMSHGLEPCRRWLRTELVDYHNIRSGRRDDVEGVGRGEIVKSQTVVWAADPTVAATLISGFGSNLYRLPWVLRTRPVTAARTWLAVAGWAAATAAVTFTVGYVQQSVDGVTVVAVAVAVAAAAAAAVRRPHWPNRAAARWAGMHRYGLVPVERPWWGSPTRWVAYVAYRTLLSWSRRDLQHDREGRRISGAYPLRHRTVALNTEHAAMLAAIPPAHDAATTVATSRRSSPAVVVARSAAADLTDGSQLGHDPDGHPIVLLDHDRRYGLFVVGEPGSGKSVVVAQMFAQDAAARHPGASARRRDGQMAMLWLETKGEGADLAGAALTAAGYQPSEWVRLDVVGRTGPRLELVDRNDPAGSADRIVAAIVYAFEYGSVGAASQAALRRALTVALHVDRECAAAAGWSQLPSPMRIATTLLGGDADPAGRLRLLDALQAAALTDLHRRGLQLPTEGSDSQGPMVAAATDEVASAGPSGSPLYDALRDLMYYEMLPARQRTELVAAPLNKLSVLAPLDGLWVPDPDRPAVTIDELLRWHGVAIVNLGSGPSGTADELTSARLASMLLHLLWDRIRTTCSGWLEADRSVGIYADEVSNLAGGGSGTDVIGELYDKGRSYGVQLTLATQRFAQLPDRTRTAMLGFGSRLYLQTEAVDAAAAACEDLNGGPEGPFVPADLRQLRPGHGIGRFRHDGIGHPIVVAVNHPLHQPPPSPRVRGGPPGRPSPQPALPERTADGR